MTVENEQIRISDAKFLPIVAAYAERIGLVETIDSQLNSKMEVSPGRVVLAMILDALSGRSPLFRMKEFFADKETELLLGVDVPVAKLKDHTLGCVLERMAAVGTNNILGAVILGVMKYTRLLKMEMPQAAFGTRNTRRFYPERPYHVYVSFCPCLS